MKTKKILIIGFLVFGIILSMAFPVFAKGSIVNMASMHELKSDYVRVIDSGITDSYGKSYDSNIIRFSTSNDAFVTYDLNGQYTTFEGSIVCGEDTGSDSKIYVGIYADGEKVYELKDYTRQKAAESFNIDVSGVGVLSIKTTATYGWKGYLYFVESSFVKADSIQYYPDRSELSDMVVIDSKACRVSDRLLVDVFGNVHNGWTRLTCGDKGYVLFNLDKKYLTLSGSIVTTDRTGSDAVMDIEFFLDDNPVYSSNGVTRTSSAIDFTLDVSNASVLKITTSRTSGFDSEIYVVDGVLKTHEHVPGDWTVRTEATCTEDGEKVQVCKDCGDVAITDKIPATGHTPSGSWEYGDDGTCNKIQKCSVCGEVALRQTDEEVEHTPSGEWVVTREATCISEGERVQYCTICNKLLLTESIPTTDHDYGKWVTVSGSLWNNPIVKKRTCSICGDVERIEDNSTFWVKPLIIALLIILLGGTAIIIILKKRAIAHTPSSIKNGRSEKSLTDDNDNIANKPDDNFENK